MDTFTGTQRSKSQQQTQEGLDLELTFNHCMLLLSSRLTGSSECLITAGSGMSYSEAGSHVPHGDMARIGLPWSIHD